MKKLMMIFIVALAAINLFAFEPVEVKVLDNGTRYFYDVDTKREYISNKYVTTFDDAISLIDHPYQASHFFFVNTSKEDFSKKQLEMYNFMEKEKIYVLITDSSTISSIYVRRPDAILGIDLGGSEI